MISGSTALTGLLGDPVSHSLSPNMHNAAFPEMQLDWCYLAMPCKTNDLPTALEALRGLDCKGLNITIPHKETVAKLCSDLSPIAKKLGAVNTLIPNSKGGWTGTNTDVEGFLTPLKKIKKDWKNIEAIVIGSGGSARAVLAGLEELNISKINLIGRNQKKINSLISDFDLTKTKGIKTNLKSYLIEDLEIINLIQRAGLIVNATPIGMKNKNTIKTLQMPLGKDIWTNLNPHALLYDLIYTPRPTTWLAWGCKAGFTCIDGLEMLLGQGAASLSLWSGTKKIPINTMRNALNHSIEN